MNASSTTIRTASLGRARIASLPTAASLVLRMLENVRGGVVDIRFPHGEHAVIGEGHLIATLHVHSWSVFERILSKGSIGFAEDYMEGLWTTDHLEPLLTLMAKNRDGMERAIHGSALRLIGYRLWHLLRANTRTGSRKNIEAHYDLGNDFYKLWLDETMTYSSALFDSPTQTLEEAQLEKYRRILRQINAQPGQKILEIGCGWGGFAEVATLEFGCHVRGLTLSPSQREWAIDRAFRRGFSDRATFDLCDYRDAQGSYDHIVSIEMVEAVGQSFWPTYFAQLRALLAPGGRIVVQGITIADDLFKTYSKNIDFIQRYIFPGGMLPSPKAFQSQVLKAGLKISNDLAFGLDYARTLAIWHERFNTQLDGVRAEGFDDRFICMWQFYLAYCEAGFRAGSTDVHQYELVHA